MHSLHFRMIQFRLSFVTVWKIPFCPKLTFGINLYMLSEAQNKISHVLYKIYNFSLKHILQRTRWSLKHIHNLRTATSCACCAPQISAMVPCTFRVSISEQQPQVVLDHCLQHCDVCYVNRPCKRVNSPSIHGWPQGTKYWSSMGYRVVCCKLPRMQQSQLFYKRNFICFYIKLLYISTTENDN